MKLVEFMRNTKIVLQVIDNETIVCVHRKKGRYFSVHPRVLADITYEDGTYIFITVTFLSDFGPVNVFRYVFNARTFEFVAEHDGSCYWSISAPNGFEYIWCGDKIYLATYTCPFPKGILFINENEKVIVSTWGASKYHFVKLGTIDNALALMRTVKQEAF